MTALFRVFMPVLTALAVCLASAAPSAAQGPLGRKGDDFSADEVHLSHGRQSTAKVFMSQGKMRRESQGMIVIARFDKQVAWMIDPSQKSYFETSLDPKKFPMMAEMIEKGDKGVEKVELGREQVQGFDCTKYKVTVDMGGPPPGMPPAMAAKMNGPRKMTSTVWISDKLGAALKSATDEGFSMEMTNIKVGPQPAELFEPPAGYAKVDLSPMMRGMMGGHGGQTPPNMPGMKGKMPQGMQGQMPPGAGGDD